MCCRHYLDILGDRYIVEVGPEPRRDDEPPLCSADGFDQGRVIPREISTGKNVVAVTYAVVRVIEGRMIWNAQYLRQRHPVRARIPLPLALRVNDDRADTGSQKAVLK